MNVLITGAASLLGRAIAAELATDHRLRLFDSTPVDPGEKAEFVQGDLTDPEIVRQAVCGIDAILHTGEPPSELPEDSLEREQCLLDHATRGTHVLFSTGVEAGVRRFVYGSTLEIFTAYPDDIYISETWKPLPSPEMESMSRYLGELACREFARDHMIGITALRLGRLVLEEEVEDREPDLMWLDLRDAAQAFSRALQRDTGASVRWTGRWGLFHICADIPNAKYLIGPARSMGYVPQHNFAHHWPPADAASRPHATK
jgi:nucleoside-diphosphate-sugar epimerase